MDRGLRLLQLHLFETKHNHLSNRIYFYLLIELFISNGLTVSLSFQTCWDKNNSSNLSTNIERVFLLSQSLPKWSLNIVCNSLLHIILVRIYLLIEENFYLLPCKGLNEILRRIGTLVLDYLYNSLFFYLHVYTIIL